MCECNDGCLGIASTNGIHSYSYYEGEHCVFCGEGHNDDCDMLDED